MQYHLDGQTDRNQSSGVLELKIQQLLECADININGSHPWDIQVYNPKLYQRIISHGSLGLGEAYMLGWWDCQQLDDFFARLLNAELAKQVKSWPDRWLLFKTWLLNRQRGESQNLKTAEHYEIDTDLYSKMLDSRMIYTCGYWRDAENLDQAQTDKLDLVAKKLGFKAGMKVLDIGCGWGGSALYLAEKYDIEITGISISESQINYAQQHNSHPNLTFICQDYSHHQQQYDRIYSLGMFEHVGFKNYARFFNSVNRNLKSNGLFLLHTIGHRITNPNVDPWIDRYIFPNGVLPSAEQISKHSNHLFTIQDWHNFGLDYHRTLLEWDKNCARAWHQLENYDSQFQRMWHYYLMSAASTFKAGRNHLWQIVFSKGVQNKPYYGIRSARADDES